MVIRVQLKGWRGDRSGGENCRARKHTKKGKEESVMSTDLPLQKGSVSKKKLFTFFICEARGRCSSRIRSDCFRSVVVVRLSHGLHHEAHTRKKLWLSVRCIYTLEKPIRPEEVLRRFAFNVVYAFSKNRFVVFLKVASEPFCLTILLQASLSRKEKVCVEEQKRNGTQLKCK